MPPAFCHGPDCRCPSSVKWGSIKMRAASGQLQMYGRARGSGEFWPGRAVGGTLSNGSLTLISGKTKGICR
jgi:hypothetical protein